MSPSPGAAPTGPGRPAAPGPAAPGPAARRQARLGAALLILLLALSVAAFALTRAARSADDLVHTVELTPRIEPGEAATVRFSLARADGDVDVEIIDGSPGGDDELVRVLARGEALGAGAHELRWRGRDEAGEPVPAGAYALRVVLGEEGRDIRPPGRIRVAGAGG